MPLDTESTYQATTASDSSRRCYAGHWLWCIYRLSFHNSQHTPESSRPRWGRSSPTSIARYWCSPLRSYWARSPATKRPLLKGRLTFIGYLLQSWRSYLHLLLQLRQVGLSLHHTLLMRILEFLWHLLLILLFKIVKSNKPSINHHSITHTSYPSNQ